MVDISHTRQQLSILLLAAMLLAGKLWAQQVDVGVDAADPSVQVRVQDPDQRSAGVILGGLAAVTWKQTAVGNSPMYGVAPYADGTANDLRQRSYNPSTTNQLSSISSASTWSAAANASGYIASNEGRGSSISQSVKPPTKSGARKSIHWGEVTPGGMDIATLRNNLALANSAISNLNTANLGTGSDAELAFSHAGTSAVLLKATRRKMNQINSRPGRMQLNAFQKRAEAEEESVDRWQENAYKMATMEEERHESALLIRYGYGAQSAEKTRRKGGKTLSKKRWTKDR
jgi:hypothetical protein